MADIVTGLTALKTAFDLAKDIKNASGAYYDAEMRLKFSELYSALSEAKIELADAQLEMYELKRKVVELQGKLDASNEIVFRESVYWRLTSSVSPCSGLRATFITAHPHDVSITLKLPSFPHSRSMVNRCSW